MAPMMLHSSASVTFWQLSRRLRGKWWVRHVAFIDTPWTMGGHRSAPSHAMIFIVIIGPFVIIKFDMSLEC